MRLSRVHATNGLGKRQPKAAKTPQHMRLGIGQVLAGGATRKQKQVPPSQSRIDNDGPIEQKSKHQRMTYPCDSWEQDSWDKEAW